LDNKVIRLVRLWGPPSLLFSE